MNTSLSALQDAVDRLHFGVGVWFRGEPHLTVQTAWDRRPQTAEGQAAVDQLIATHRSISAGSADERAQAALTAASYALDPSRCGAPDIDDSLRLYKAALVTCARNHRLAA